MKNTNTELSESPDVLLELQQTRAELKRIQEIHEALLNSIDEMLWTIDMSTGKMIDVSSACERIFGYGSEELCDIIDVWKQFVHPADHKMMERSNDDLMAGKPVRKQFRIIHKDDSVKWLESKITPTLNEKGELIRLSGVTRDISKEKKANKALMESESLFRQFFDHAHEALLILDADTGYFCDYNQNALQLFKCSGSQMLSRTPAMLSPLYQPDGTASADKADQYIKQTLAGLKPKFEWVIQDDDENLIPCEVKLNLINSQGRRLVRSSIVDISERKRAEAEIQALNESLEAKVQERTAEPTTNWRPLAIRYLMTCKHR